MTEVDAVTALVATGNVALVVPAATVTLPGTEATDELLLDSVTTAPPTGAGSLNPTVPKELIPPGNEDGFSVKEDNEVSGHMFANGSTAAYFRTRTLLNSATVPGSP
jgi:hypothetical protein